MVPFFKMTGSGNDFVLLDGRATDPSSWTAERIAAVCDRRRGVGADGLVILTPDPALDGSGAPVVGMRYHNADGSEAALCGNATLCSTRLAARLGLAPAAGMSLRTGAGLLATRCLAEGELAEMRFPDIVLPEGVAGIRSAAGEHWIRFLVAGVPHVVVRVDDVSAVDVESRGRELRHHFWVGAEGANANFVSPPTGAAERWSIRTFERGVEGETLACGTGTVASALALRLAGEIELPVGFTSRGGSPLGVRARLESGWARDVWLAGEGKLVFEGRLPD